MLLAARAKNYQNLVYSRIAFAPGMNCIVGPTDAGKSTWFRNLRWCAQNRPSGDGNIRHGQKECRSQLLTDTVKLTRTRTTTENSYTLTLDGEQPQVFKAIGQDVPDAVTQAIGLADVNFQDQFDGPFWFCLSPGERARAFNEVVDLTAIDVGLARMASLCKSKQTEVELFQSQHKDAQNALEALNHVPDVVACLEALEAQESALETARKQSEQLSALIASVTKAGEARQKAANRVATLEVVEASMVALEAVERKLGALRAITARIAERTAQIAKPLPTDTEIEELAALDAELEAKKQRSANLTALIARISKVKLIPLPPESEIEKLAEMETAIKEKQDKLKRLRACTVKIAEASVRFRLAVVAVEEAEKELATIPVCPSCGKETGECDEQ